MNKQTYWNLFGRRRKKKRGIGRIRRTLWWNVHVEPLPYVPLDLLGALQKMYDMIPQQQPIPEVHLYRLRR